MSRLKIPATKRIWRAENGLPAEGLQLGRHTTWIAGILALRPRVCKFAPGPPQTPARQVEGGQGTLTITLPVMLLFAPVRSAFYGACGHARHDVAVGHQREEEHRQHDERAIGRDDSILRALFHTARKPGDPHGQRL